MRRLVAVLLMMILLGGCTAREQSAQETVFAMDTVMDLKIWGEDSPKAAQQLRMLLQDLEDTWSAADPDSALSAYNRGEAALTDAQQAMLQKLLELSDRTGGTFDPQLGAVIDAWGFLEDTQRLPTDKELETALIDRKWNLGAALKGYAGDLAVERLAALDVDRAILNLGGNVQTYGEKPDGSPWSIAIQNPDGGEAIGIVSVTGTAAVVTSGDYQRYFEVDGVRYHHIIDPKTGYPADSGLSSATVICRNGLTADALSTALLVMGLETGAEFWRQSDDFEAVFLLRSGEIYATEGAGLSGCKYEVIHREN